MSTAQAMASKGGRQARDIKAVVDHEEPILVVPLRTKLTAAMSAAYVGRRDGH
jgi:hypothetical protein